MENTPPAIPEISKFELLNMNKRKKYVTARIGNWWETYAKILDYELGKGIKHG